MKGTDTDKTKDVLVEKFGWPRSSIHNGTAWIAFHLGLDRLPDWLTPSTYDFPRYDWALTAESARLVPVGFVDDEAEWVEYALWIIENGKGRWSPHRRLGFYFEHEEDAALFKLRFL